MVEEEIKSLITAAIKKTFQIDFEDVPLEHPNNIDHGDYSTSVSFSLAKSLKQSPMDIAKKLSYEIEEVSKTDKNNNAEIQYFEKVEIASPGFINIVLSKKWLYKLLQEINLKAENYGVYRQPSRQKIALEHSNVNPNKAAHIGHLRNACIGQFIERIYEFIGQDVSVQYLDNDLGVQVTTSLMGTEKILSIKPNEYEKFDHYAWDVYAQMESQIAGDENLQTERVELMKRLEDANDPVSKKQDKLALKILNDQLKTFQRLEFDYDVIIRERDIVNLKLWERTFEKLKNNKNVYFAQDGPSKGCWLIKMKNEDKAESSGEGGHEEDKIIVRSNGVPTYTGKDIAYHLWKFGLLDTDFYYKKFDSGTQEKELWITTSDDAETEKNKITFTNSDSVVNVIDVKQTYAIESVKQAIRHLGYPQQAENIKHVNYGFVYVSAKTAEFLGIDTSDDKTQYAMSGRKGWGVKIDDFIDMVDTHLKEEHGDFTALQDVRNGAIKFEMLKHNTFQDIVFDLDSALNIHGFSGPYIQYTHARASSVLEKAKDFTSDLPVETPDFTEETEILRHIYKFPEIVQRASEEFAPNLLCNFLFELCQKYNNFYNDVPIIKTEDKELKAFRLFMTKCVKQVLSNGLYLLGIKAPSRV